VTIYDVGEHQNRVFMVMEIMRGGTVGDAMKSGREIPPKVKLRWLREAGGALDTAHDMGVVHRDIKPGNLLLDEHDRLAVADFGIARVAWEDQLTATGQVLGTAAYLSPEQALGEAAQPASDRYALAVVAYELLTGSRPFEADHFAAQARAHIEDPVPPASTRAPELSRAVDAVLERGLAKEPGDRWESAAAFVDALERTLDEDPAPTSPTRKLGRRERRAPAPAPVTPREPDTAEHPVRGREPWAASPPPRRTDTPPSRTSEPEPSRSGAGPLIGALLALVLLAGAGVFVLATRGDDEPTPRAQNEPTAEPTRESTPEPTPEETETATPAPTETATPEPTDTPTPEPTPEDTPEAPQGEPDLEGAQEAQLAGYNARQAGDFQTALTKAQEAQKLCAGSKELSPCGFAVYEEGVALMGLGQPEAAIPILQRRLDEFGDNEGGEVRRALRDAKKAARGN
jgi:serine/threonine-protein kinase